MENNELTINDYFDYFDGIIKFEDFDFDNILLDEKSNENISLYDVLWKTFIGAKLLCSMFDKVDGFITVNDETRYLVSFGLEKLS